jgi:hypothetical protein
MKAGYINTIDTLKRAFDGREIESKNDKQRSDLTPQERGLAAEAERNFKKLWEAIKDVPDLADKGADGVVKIRVTEVKGMCDEFARQYDRRKDTLHAEEFRHYSAELGTVLQDGFKNAP